MAFLDDSKAGQKDKLMINGIPVELSMDTSMAMSSILKDKRPGMGIEGAFDYVSQKLNTVKEQNAQSTQGMDVKGYVDVQLSTTKSVFDDLKASYEKEPDPIPENRKKHYADSLAKYDGNGHLAAVIDNMQQLTMPSDDKKPLVSELNTGLLALSAKSKDQDVKEMAAIGSEYGSVLIGNKQAPEGQKKEDFFKEKIDQISGLTPPPPQPLEAAPQEKGFMEKVGDFFEQAGNTIKEAASAVGNWIDNNITKPILEAIGTDAKGAVRDMFDDINVDKNVKKDTVVAIGNAMDRVDEIGHESKSTAVDGISPKDLKAAAELVGNIGNGMEEAGQAAQASAARSAEAGQAASRSGGR